MVSKINHNTMDLSCTNAHAISNLYTGRLLIKTPLLSIGAASFAFDVHLIYDSQFIENYVGNQEVNTFLPFGWRLNVHQYLKYHEVSTNNQSLNYFEYFDQAGYKHTFKYLKQNYFYDTGGLGLRLEIDNGIKTIKDNLGNTVVFNQNNQIDRVVSGINSGIVKKYNYIGNKLNSIYDIRKPQRAINFIYDNEYINEIKMSDNSHGYKFEYHGNKLININEFSKTTCRKHLSVGYQNGVLSYILSGDLSYLKFGFNSDMTRKVTSGVAKINEGFKTDDALYYLGDNQILGDDVYLGEKETVLDYSELLFLNDGVKETLDILYEDVHKRSVTNKQNVKIVFFYDQDGNVTSEFEEVSSNEYKSLFKPQGWQMHNPSVETGLRINGNLGINLDVTGPIFNFPQWRFDKFKDDINSLIRYQNEVYFNLSFWIKFPTNDVTDITITNSIYAKGIPKVSKVHIKKIFKNSLAFVTIPISIVGFDKRELGSMSMELSHNAEFHLFDVRLSPASKTEIEVANTNLSDIEYLVYKDKFNNSHQITLNSSSHFLTINDLYTTYKNIYNQSNGDTFELVMNSQTKVYEVKSVFVIDLDNNYQQLKIIDGKPNLYLGIRRKNGSYKWLIQESQIYFNQNYVIQKTLIDTVLDVTSKITSTNNIMINEQFNNGLPRYSKDLKNIVDVKTYDTYWNITKTEKYNASNLDGDKIVTTFEYGNLVDELRELPSSITSNGKTVNYTYEEPFMIEKAASSNLIAENQYTTYKDKIQSRYLIDNNNIISKITYGHDQFGMLNYSYNYSKYSVKRDEFLNNTKYYLDNQLVLEVTENENQITEKNYNGELITLKTTALDKYDRVKSIQTLDSIITYKYQDEGNPYSPGDSRYDAFYFEESSILAKVTQLMDPYENCTYNFHYNEDNSLYSYDNGNSNFGVEVKQKNNEEIEYKYGSNKNIVRTSTVKHDVLAMYPKLIKTIDDKDQNSRNYEYSYLYDNLLSENDPYERIKRIHGSYKNDSDFHHQKTEFVYKVNSNELEKQRTQLMWYAPGFTSNTIETSFSKVENDLTINEYISMHTVVADRYGHEISDIETGMGKIYKSTTYTLDKLKRVKKEVNSKLGTFDYEYIGATNKISKVKKNGTVYKNFNYVNNRLRLYNGSLVSYDSYGNIIKLDNQNILYNDRNLISSHGENSYLYNHNGIRIKKQNKNSYSLFYLDGTKILAEYVYSTDGTLDKVYHFYYNALGIAGVEYNGRKYNYLIDGQGNVSKVFFEGRMIAEYIYDSFGNDEINYLFANDDEEKAFIEDNPFRWKSYYKDTETGLIMIYINGKTRYYDPSIGQFISQDYDCLNPQAIGGLYLYSLESTFSVSNPLQVTSNHVNILSSLPLISEDDSSGSGKSSPWEWYHWVALGVGAAITIASGGILIAGAVGVISTGTLVGATVIGAAKGALIGAGIGAATGALGGAIGAGVSGTSGTEFWNMVGQGAVMGFGTGSITGAITGGIQGYNGWFQARALEFTNYGTTNEVVLGRSADNYHLVAQSRNATYFHTTDVRWAQVQAMRGVGTKGMWKINQVFLNNQIALGRTFYLASQPVKYGFFGKEIAYLMML